MDLILAFLLTISVFFVSVLIYFRPSLGIPLIIAFVVRTIVMISGIYFLSLPDSTADAMAFQDWAMMRSALSVPEIIQTFSFNSYFYPDIVAIFYRLLEPDVLVMHVLNLLAGVGVVYSVGVLTYELWGESASRKASLVAALFPSLILYSAVTLREPLLTLSLLLTCIGYIRWLKSYSLRHAIATIGFSFLGTCFHSAHAINFGWLLICILIFAFLKMMKKAPILLHMNNVCVLTVALCGLICIAVYFQYIELNKLGSLGTTDIDALIQYSEKTNRDLAAYPDWLKIERGIDYAWKWIVRLPYFLFSPFLWDVKTPAHILGMLDGFNYIVLFLLAMRSRATIISNRQAVYLLLLLLPMLMVYSMFVGNFGTGLRHRSKFVPIAISISIGSFILSRKSLKYAITTNT